MITTQYGGAVIHMFIESSCQYLSWITRQHAGSLASPNAASLESGPTSF